MLPEIARKPTEALMVSADGKLPRGYFVANVKGRNTLYVLRGETIIGRIELTDNPVFTLRGTIRSVIGPTTGDVFYGNLVDSEHLGELCTYTEAFDSILKKYEASKAISS